MEFVSVLVEIFVVVMFCYLCFFNIFLFVRNVVDDMRYVWGRCFGFMWGGCRCLEMIYVVVVVC